jgi:hypothetical protein
MPPKGYRKNKPPDITPPTESLPGGPFNPDGSLANGIAFAEPTPACEECANCAFYLAKEYRCRFFPRSQSDFYPIKPDDWCGQFKSGT